MTAEKTLVLVGAPPGCGKTFFARSLAKALDNSVFLDLDVLNPLSEGLCRQAGQPFDKGGEFFRENVRELEYQVLLDIAFGALEYNRTVLVSAPFTKEFRERSRMDTLRAKAALLDACVQPVWILSDKQTCLSNMLRRAVSRDRYKIAAFDQYADSVDFAPPKGLEGLFVVDNRGDSLLSKEIERLKTFLISEGQ